MAKILLVSHFLVLLQVFQFHAAPLFVTPIRFMASASGLPTMDPFSGAPDPFATVLFADSYVGATETIDDSHNPNWQTLFTIEYTEGSQESLRLILRDEDGGFIFGNLGEGVIDVQSLVDFGEARANLQDCVNDNDDPCGTVRVTMV